MLLVKLFHFTKKQTNLNLKLLCLIFFGTNTVILGQDVVHLKDGTSVSCLITEITDFILYAEIDNDPYIGTFFADDVSHLKIHPENIRIIKQLKKGAKEAMKYSNPLEDNKLYGFYFGMPYDSIAIAQNSKTLYKKDSVVSPILVPYDPLEKSFSERLKSLGKSIGGNSLAWLIGGL